MTQAVHRLTSLVIILAVTTLAKDQTRWSRQISSYTSDIGDWVPLPGPVEREPVQIKRQAVAEPRILTEPFPGLPRPSGFSSDLRNYNNALNKQLYLQSVPSAPQNFLSDQGFGHSIRFGLSQPNFPLNQGFISPQFGYEGIPSLPQAAPQAFPQIPQIKPSIPFIKPQNPIKFDYTKTTPQQLPTIPAKTFNQPQKIKAEAPKVDGYRVENTPYDLKKKPQSLQKIKFDYEKVPRIEIPQSPKPQSKVEKEEVQLLYVPLESLNRGQFNFRSPLTTPQIVNSDLYAQGPNKMTELHRPIVKSIENPPIQNYFSEFNSQFNHQLKEIDQVPKFSTLSSPFPTSPPTTPKPKKLKPHQPPLAIFLTEEASKNNQIKVGDVLNSLKTANSVAVLDSVNPLNAPKVFIGPSSLQPPERYVKFELPYLSNIDSSDKKLRQLPFFVAPLSYNTPQGFAKIPFPSPHVGSVVINAQIKETTPEPEFKPNYYTGTYNQEQKPVTQKPSVSYYTTASPKTTIKDNFQSNYYQFEPQTVSTLKPVPTETIPPGRAGNYYLSHTDQYNPQYETSHYNPTHYEVRPQEVPQNYQPLQEPAKTYPPQRETTTTPTTTTTTKPPSTYPSQLLETHNPYSINQAFHFSTPLDYRSYSDDFKEPKPIATPIATEIPTASTSPAPKEEVTEKRYQSSPVYQSYTPEVHYESEIQNQRYPLYNTNEYTKTESAEVYNPIPTSNTDYVPTNPTYNEYTNTNTENQDTQTPVQNETSNEEIYDKISPTTENEAQKYESSQSSNSNEEPSSTTTTTTTKRPLRNRGRPRYTTTPRSDSSEYATRITRKPLRRPLPSRPRYEPNKITTDKPTRNDDESTTKSIRTRNRGRVTYKPADDDYDRRKTHNSKEKDLAYQRDVLHQNYPVTLMERASTVDIEAITEPIGKSEEPAADTENAYTYERATISQQNPNLDDDIPVFPSRTTASQAESSYVPRLSTPDDYVYHSRSSLAPAVPTSYEEFTEKEELPKPTTPIQSETNPVEIVTEPTLANDQAFTEHEDYKEGTTAIPETEATKASQEEEENVVQTTPSYNRVRVRPGVVKQYHQASTESSRIKSDKRKPVTYRPAFDKRRTTMRIDEIQQDLKTKQVRGRQEDENRHPVYKPELTTEDTTQEASTKRGAFRRRRPSYSYTTASTEGSQRKYEVKNRFRGRRPTTDKPTEKAEVSETTTARTYSRYQRPKLSERFKKPEPEEAEDQDSNFSINRLTYTSPNEKWSPKLDESFKPYNPNTIADEEKGSTTERRSDRTEMDIITARNEFEDILISVTPATNKKKIPDIPPTLEALVEQSKVTKSDSNENMSTFESMLEEVMKSLEEQDENEYSSKVMKHKGGEIGEIPPESIISSGESNTKATTVQEETTTVAANVDDSINKEEEIEHKTRRRGYWKKVKVRPLASETIETAESQYYPHTVNRLGQSLDKSDDEPYEKKVSVTTYKPAFQFKDIFGDVTAADVASFEISKLTQEAKIGDNWPDVEISNLNTQTDRYNEITAIDEAATDKTSPGDFDLGTGSPDPKLDDMFTTTEATTTTAKFSFMDYLFGTGEDKNEAQTDTLIEITTEQSKAKMPTTENSFMPDEITEDESTVLADIKKINATEATEITTDKSEAPEMVTNKSESTETITNKSESTVTVTNKSESIEIITNKSTEMITNKSETPETTPSSFMNPANVISTSMSTEISHETEICFRGKCIKTFRDISKV